MSFFLKKKKIFVCDLLCRSVVVSVSGRVGESAVSEKTLLVNRHVSQLSVSELS